MTWETDEVERWIANDEALYHAVRLQPRQHVEGIIRDWAKTEPAGFDVALSQVDWDSVADAAVHL